MAHVMSRPKILPISFKYFVVFDTTAILGMWDHSLDKY